MYKASLEATFLNIFSAPYLYLSLFNYIKNLYRQYLQDLDYKDFPIFQRLSYFCSCSGSFAEGDTRGGGIGAQSMIGNTTASKGLEYAVTNLQEYCNG